MNKATIVITGHSIVPEVVSKSDENPIEGYPYTFEDMAYGVGYMQTEIEMCVDGRDVKVLAFIHRADLRKIGLIKTITT